MVLDVKYAALYPLASRSKREASENNRYSSAPSFQLDSKVEHPAPSDPQRLVAIQLVGWCVAPWSRCGGDKWSVHVSNAVSIFGGKMI